MTLKQNKSEILWNVINSCLAGALVFIGACVDGEITSRAVAAAFLAGALVAVTKFKEYWDGEKKEYQRNIFTFI